ncbi:hypothetical protein [Pseudomonas sp.]|uniref:hypothetical protein n=1 Tax=Pseudomonas sp. TaxID=306 RepID=UPI0031E442B6
MKGKFVFLCFVVGFSTMVVAGEDLNSSRWSLGWSNKATIISKENKHTYVRVVQGPDDLRLAYIVSGEGACAAGVSEFKEKGSVNGKAVNFSGSCSDENYKELVPESEAEEALVEKEFLSGKNVIFKIGKLPKRTFSSERFKSTVESVGLNVSEVE